MRLFRVRVRRLVHGNYAVERLSFPWLWWRECPEWDTRTPTKDEAIKRATALLTTEIIGQREIQAAIRNS